jgi:hypothetical protein
MKRYLFYTFACTAVACLYGCASLQVERVDNAGVNAPMKGKFTYFLPRSAINIALSVTVSQCGKLVADPTADEYKKAPPDPSAVKFKTTATLSSAIEADPNFEYAIDVDAARTWTKEINFTVNTNANKTFSSFNGQINDQAGPTILAAATSAIQILGAVSVPVVPGLNLADEAVNAETYLQIPTPTLSPIIIVPAKLDGETLCSHAVRDTLPKVARDQVEIQALTDEIKAYRKKLSTGAAAPGKLDPTLTWAAAVTALQADVATLSAKLTVSINYKFVPRSDDPFTLATDGYSYIELFRTPINALVMKLLSDDGTAWYKNLANANDASWLGVHMPAVFSLAIDRRTYFNEIAYKQAGKQVNYDTPDGLLIRDPAVGFVQNCTVTAQPGVPAGQEKSDGASFMPILKFCDQPQLNLTETTANGDGSTRLAVTAPQLGRVLVLDESSALFENDSLGVNLNADASIQSVSTHDISSAATGFSSLGTAASDASSAIASRNTAVSSQNTALSTQVQLPDTINKARADCYTQATAVTAAGGKPVDCK